MKAHRRHGGPELLAKAEKECVISNTLNIFSQNQYLILAIDVETILTAWSALYRDPTNAELAGENVRDYFLTCHWDSNPENDLAMKWRKSLSHY